jgi:hypothetical protein
MRGSVVALAVALAALPAHAETQATERFVAANIIATLYHEVGHALLALRDDPSDDQVEEDAADALSVVLIDRLHDEGAGQEIIRQVATAYALYDAQPPDQRWNYGDAHSRDLVRYQNLVCLFYGADTDAREALADELGLAPERRESCPEEFQAAADDWDIWLDGMAPQDHMPGLRLVVPPDRDALTATVSGAVRTLNGEISLPRPVDVTVEPCGEANAFYDPRADRIVICTEYAAELARLHEADAN